MNRFQRVSCLLVVALAACNGAPYPSDGDPRVDGEVPIDTIVAPDVVDASPDAADAAPDVADASPDTMGDVVPTSLDGSVPCGASTCTSGQLCVHTGPGVDAGAGATGFVGCVAAPNGCTLVDCNLSCSSSNCGTAVCAPTPASSVTGRNVYCTSE